MIRMSDAEVLGKYLGVPMMQGRVSRHHFDDLLANVDNHLASRILKFSPLQGVLPQKKYVLSALPNHLMQSVYLPKSVCDEFDKWVRRFIQGDQKGGQRVHLVKWTQLCLSLHRGGLGLKLFRLMNSAFMLIQDGGFSKKIMLCGLEF